MTLTPPAPEPTRNPPVDISGAYLVRRGRILWTATRNNGPDRKHYWYLWRGGPQGTYTAFAPRHGVEILAELRLSGEPVPPADQIAPDHEDLLVVEHDGRFWYGARSRAARPDRGGGAQWYLFWYDRTTFATDDDVTTVGVLTAG